MPLWGIIVLIIIAILFAYVLFALFTIFSLDKHFFGVRTEDPDHPCYVRREDYPSLAYEEYGFEFYKGEYIRGYIYTDKNVEFYKGFIILAHGMFGTHVQYLCDVKFLTEAGYKVLAFDHFGCGMSDGKKIISLCQGMYTLDAVIKDVEYRKINGDLNIILYGHSWGAFSIGGALAYHPEIHKAVARSGPTNIRDSAFHLTSLSHPYLMAFVRPAAYFLYPMLLGQRNNIKATFGLKKNKKTPTLFIQAEDDNMVKESFSLARYYQKHPQDNAYTFFTPKGLHNSIITEESLAAFINMHREWVRIQRLEGEEKALAEKQFYASMDRAKMIVYQEEVKNKILDFLQD